MSSGKIKKDDFLKIVVRIFDETFKNKKIKINIYSIIRLSIISCHTYSNKEVRLHSGGVKDLVILSLWDVIKKLSDKEKIDKETYAYLKKEYKLLKSEGMIEECVDETIILVTSLYSKSESCNDKDGCIIS